MMRSALPSPAATRPESPEAIQSANLCPDIFKHSRSSSSSQLQFFPTGTHHFFTPSIACLSSTSSKKNMKLVPTKPSQNIAEDAVTLMPEDSEDMVSTPIHSIPSPDAPNAATFCDEMLFKTHQLSPTNSTIVACLQSHHTRRPRHGACREESRRRNENR